MVIDIELLKRAQHGLQTAAQQIGNVITALSEPAEHRSPVFQFGWELGMRETPRVAIRNAEEALERIKAALSRGQN